MTNDPQRFDGSIAFPKGSILSQTQRIWVLILLLALCFLAAVFPQVLSRVTGQEWLISNADTSLTQSLKQDSTVFATLSGIKALLGVIEGSTVGVSLGASIALQLGDLVQPAYEYFSFIWEIFLCAIFLLSMYKLVLESGVLGLGLLIAGVGAFLAVFSAGPGKSRSGFLSSARSLTVGGLLLSFGIPLAVLCTSALSKHYLEPLKQTSWTDASAQLQALQEAVQELATVQEKLSILHPGESVNEVIVAGRVLGDKASQIAWSTFSSLLYYLSAMVLELLLLPMLLLWTFRSTLRASLDMFRSAGL